MDTIDSVLGIGAVAITVAILFFVFPQVLSALNVSGGMWDLFGIVFALIPIAFAVKYFMHSQEPPPQQNQYY